MVTPEGILPNHKITNKYLERTFGDDEFSKIHPAFLWVFRASRSWASIRDLVPGMKAHLINDDPARRLYPRPSKFAEDDLEMDVRFAAIFKELFCMAASSLAEEIHQPLEKLGVLYEAPLSTGIVEMGKSTRRLGMLVQRKQTPAMLDIESGHSYIFGKGQFLFVCRQLSRAESTRLQASGFRFATIPQIADILSHSMRIASPELIKQMEDIRVYSKGQQMLTPGVHVACFMLRPTVRKGFDVLAKNSARNQLPMVSLPIESLDPLQQAILTSMNDWTVASMLKSLKPEPDDSFRKQLYRVIAQLAADVEDPAIMHARFSAKPILAPCMAQAQTKRPGKCTLLCLRLIGHLEARAPNAEHIYVPLQLFNAHQQVYSGAADTEAFGRQIHRELFQNKVDTRRTSTQSRPTASFSGSQTHLVPVPSMHGKDVVGNPPATPNGSAAEHNKYLGIMVTENVSVDVTASRSSSGEDDFDLREALGTTGNAAAAPAEIETYVDEMMALLRS